MDYWFIGRLYQYVHTAKSIWPILKGLWRGVINIWLRSCLGPILRSGQGRILRVCRGLVLIFWVRACIGPILKIYWGLVLNIWVRAWIGPIWRIYGGLVINIWVRACIGPISRAVQGPILRIYRGLVLKACIGSIWMAGIGLILRVCGGLILNFWVWANIKGRPMADIMGLWRAGIKFLIWRVVKGLILRAGPCLRASRL